LRKVSKLNVRWSMRQILESPEGHMKLVGAIYELETGRVRFRE
jgi:carbonic anhydrase